jgi:hypothetical protein
MRQTPRLVTQPLWRQIMAPLASLRLTVALFAMSMILVFYGTWAQVDQGIWTVVNTYFRSLWVWIPIKVILFHSIDSSPFSIPFPGGWLLGGVLLTNLLAAHFMRFKLTWKRAGIFILHGGLIVMMLGEFVTGLFAVEGIMQIEEKGVANYVQHAMSPELAIIDVSDSKIDDTVAIPHGVLRRGPVTHEKLPFNIELVEYMTNAVVTAIDPQRDKFATAGLGTQRTVVAVPEVSGADPDQKYDMPAAFIKLTDKTTGQDLGTYLVHYRWLGQQLKVGDKTYEIALRSKRSYRPYTFYLDKADHKVYPGTTIAKDFSSYVRIRDSQGKEVRSVRIFMNNPLYFQGETFYQSSMDVSLDPKITGLQVVRNPGWAMPYLSCILVTLGMLVHFGMNLTNFLQRRMAS